MSIISVGKRIGDLDIRLGIPPSKAQFDKGETNKKYGYINESSYKDSIFNRFRSGLTQAGGLARPTQFIATIDGPVGMQAITKNTHNNITAIGSQSRRRMYQSMSLADAIRKNINLRMDLFCSEVTIPEKTITDDVNEQYYGPSRQMAKNTVFNDLTLTYYTGIDFDERIYFEAWQNGIVDPISHNLGYYDDYATPCKITVTPITKTFISALEGISPSDYGSVDNYRDMVRRLLGNTSGFSAYQVQFYEVWPKTIASVPLSYSDTNALVKTTVTFAYRNYATSAWSYLSDDKFKDYTALDRTEYRNNLTAIQTGLLDNLPFGIGNEIGRVGRQVFDTIKNKLPIGRITGGMVFPKGMPEPSDFRDLIL